MGTVVVGMAEIIRAGSWHGGDTVTSRPSRGDSAPVLTGLGPGSHRFLPLTVDMSGRHGLQVTKKGWRKAKARFEAWAGSVQMPFLSPG